LNLSKIKEERLLKANPYQFPIIIKLEKIRLEPHEKEHVLFVFCHFIKGKYAFEGKIEK